MEWYQIENIEDQDTPALLIFPERVKENIRILKEFVPDLNRLRPHIKTNKCAEVCQLMLDAGISKFKCATIAEAEMLATTGARDVLLAYQPTGPKVERLAGLIKQFPQTRFSCLVDNPDIATQLDEVAGKKNLTYTVFIDLNVGMNRTGIAPESALQLLRHCRTLKNLKVAGLHAYDGHLRDPDLELRTKICDEGFARVIRLKEQIIEETGEVPVIVAGGTPSFPIHAKRKDVECSPGTFIFWDKGYEQILHEQPFLHAALVVTRVISKPAPGVVCVDLGHKAIASENPINKRVHFLNAPSLEPTGHSEEHLVLKTQQDNLKVGDILYGVPFHVCPTVALHETASVVQDHHITGSWNIVARKRKINI